MSDRADRLRKARLERGYGSAAEAARAFDWNPNTYASNENGNATFSYKKARVYALAFGVLPEWLYEGKGPMRRRDGVRLIGRVAAGEGHFEDDYMMGDGEALEPSPIEGRIALRVEGDSMVPRFMPGEVLIFGPRYDDPSSLIGRQVMARLEDGRKLVKILRPGSEPGRFTLYSVNSAYDPIENVALLWALPFQELRT